MAVWLEYGNLFLSLAFIWYTVYLLHPCEVQYIYILYKIRVAAASLNPDTFVQNSTGSPSRKPPPDNTIMHGAPQRSHQTNKTIPIFLPCSMPSSCAFFGAMSPFVMLVLISLRSDSLYKSAHVHQYADVAADVRGRSQLRPGSMARADAPLVERNPVPVFQRPR